MTGIKQQFVLKFFLVSKSCYCIQNKYPVISPTDGTCRLYLYRNAISHMDIQFSAVVSCKQKLLQSMVDLESEGLYFHM